jgi:hypothetical protein
MQEVFSRHLKIPEHKIRVIAPDIGGGFGMKLNLYSDEIATVVASMLLGRPVKFCVDRLESFVSDSQARDHHIKCRIALNKTGEITGMEMDDISAVGAYGMPLRFNVAEGMMAITLAGAPYRFENYKGRTRSVYVNKNLIGMYRGVGMPLACVATELLTDLAAAKLGLDTVSSSAATIGRKPPCLALPLAGRSSKASRSMSAWRSSSGSWITTCSARNRSDCASEGPTAASALRRSASRPPMARLITAHPAHPSPRKTAARCGSNRRAQCAASRASPIKGRAR